MDYSEFCFYTDHVTTLTKQEIENPYLIIDELCEKRTMEAFHSDLRILQSTLYRDNEWQKYNPADLYTTFEDMTRLLDALFLINEYTPEISTMLETSIKVESNNEHTIAINNLFKKDLSKNKHQDDPKETAPANILNNIYSAHYLYNLKGDLSNCLHISLDVSYMETAKHEYYGKWINDFTLLFSTLEDLITEMYQLHLKEASAFPKLTSCLESKFAINCDHPSQLIKEQIKKPYNSFYDFYHFHLNHDHIYNGINAWKQLLFEKNLWKKEQNPGNLIHLNQCLIELIDIVWLLIQNDQLKNIKKNYTPKKRYKKLIKACNDKEFNNPIVAIENFMTYKKAHEWKSLLHKWLKCSLDNDYSYKTEDKDQIDAEFNQLIKLSEAVLLLSLSSLPKKSNK